MADDSMEISSEHGQNAGDDIDIDIDLTAGQADEDYILQDALSTADYGNEFPPQPSPAVHHDDLMVDDDNASYQMDDADFTQDEAEHIAEPESMSFAQTDILYTHGDDGNAADAIIYSEDHDIGLFFGQDGGGEVEPTNRDLVLDSENISHDENTASIPEDVLPQADTIAAQDYGIQGDQTQNPAQSHGSSPQSRSPAAAPEEPRSPPASLGHSSPVRESNDTISDPPQDSQEASGEVDDPESTEHTYDPSKARAVKVVYQSVEYALFATSDSDDPDSYFLSDLAIIDKPLEQFFSAIREIIRDDLTADEELCLNIEDLGLETEEASSSLKDVTLSQILNLHDKLLRNDGVDSPGPLYLLLGTRVNFIKRLASLAEGASLGKGISEMAGLENNDEGVNDLGDGDETTRDVQSNFENQEIANDAEGDTTQGIEHGDLEDGPSNEDPVNSLEIYEEAELLDGEKEASEHHDEQHAAPKEYPEEYDEQNTIQDEYREDAKDQNAARVQYQEYDEQITTQQGEHREHRREEAKTEPEDHSLALTENTQDSTLVNNSPKAKKDLVPDLSSKHTDTVETLQESTSEVTKDTDNEEDDLIDYSDEEIQHPDEVMGRRTVVVTDGDRTDNEYQAKDEELNRRSLSRQAEEKLLEKTVDQTYADGNENYPEEYLEGNEIGYDDYNTEFQHEASDSYEFVEHNDEYNQTGHEDQDDLSNELGAFVDERADYKHDPELGTETYDNDDTNYEGPNDEEPGSQGLPTYAAPTIPQQSSEFVDINNNTNVLEGPAPSTVSSLGAAETAGSSVTLGAEEIQYEDDLDEEISNELENEITANPTNGSVVEQKDEIDYEDDEDEELPISPGPGAVQAMKELSNANGKRFIAEVESELSTPSKDAKRPRSS